MQMLHPLAAALFAVLPAAAGIWWGRELVRIAGDPAFAERLAASRSRNAFVVALSLALLFVLADDSLIWSLPLLVVAKMAATYRGRRVLHGETWTPAAYYSFFFRLVVAAYGFWMLLAAAPEIVKQFPSHEAVAAAVIGLVAFAWSAAYADVFSFLLRAKPVQDSDLCSAFERLVQACGLPRVELARVDLHGGRFANAVALPAYKRPRVLLSQTLLEQLDRDEVLGICAHELAHLEYYNPRRLHRLNALTHGLIAGGVLLSPVLRALFPASLPAVSVFWMPLVILTLIWRARHRQRHETESDLRAVALTGNAEALIRGLIKIHRAAHVARRWDPEFERQATHPSLARRIQAIRAATGGPHASLTEIAPFADPAGSTSVTFQADRLVWNEGEAATHTIGYAHLSDLRIVTTTSGAPRLLAVSTAGHKWQMVLQPGDVARVQAVLDEVDSRLANAPAPPTLPAAVPRLLTLCLMTVALTVNQFALVVVSLMACVRPAPPLAAAAGAGAVMAAILTWRDEPLFESGGSQVMAAALLLCGGLLLAVACANRRGISTLTVRKLVGGLTAGALAAVLLLALSGADVIGLHQTARYWSGAAVLPLGVAAALAVDPVRRRRYAAVPMALAGIASAYASSADFLARFSDDVFLSESQTVRVKTLGDLLTEFSVPFVATDLRLSPDGQHVAILSADEGAHGEVHVGRPGGTHVVYPADEALFIDNRQLLLLDRLRTGSALRLIALDVPEGRPNAISLAGVFATHLSIEPTAARWHLLGSNEEDEIVSVKGTVGIFDVSERRWTVEDAYDATALGEARGRALLLERHYESGFLMNGPLWQWASLLSRPEPESRLVTVDGEGGRTPVAVSRLDLNCEAPSFEPAPAMCAAFDGTRTRLFAVDPFARGVTPLATLSGHFYPRAASADGWLTGWWQGSAVAIHPQSREVVRTTNDEPRIHTVTVAGGLLATLSSTERASTIRVHALVSAN